MTISENFRIRLQNELQERCQANSRYSLRAFARSLELESSALSRLLRGKRAITPKMFEHLAARLALTPKEVAMYQGDQAPSPQFEPVEEDSFNLIAHWHNFAILELVTTSGFKSDSRWIARRLNLSVAEVNLAIERLERLGYIDINDKRDIVLRVGNTTTTHIKGSTAALRSLQSDILKKALIALESIPIEERDQSSICFAINSSKLPELKERVKKFRREIMAWMEAEETKDEVYELAISLYPVTVH